MDEAWVEIISAVREGLGDKAEQAIRELDTEALKRLWDVLDVTVREVRYEYIRRTRG